MPHQSKKTPDPFFVEALKQWRLSRHFVCTENESDFNSLVSSSIFLVKQETKHHKWLLGLRHLDWDSRHFGIKMGKIFPFITPEISSHQSEALNIGHVLLEKFVNEAIVQEYKYLSVLIHPDDTVGQHLISKAHFELMDTTVLYGLEITKQSKFNCNKEIELHIATEDDIAELQSISETCFGDRTYNVNRFNSDIFLNQNKVKELYRLWIFNSFANRGMADIVLIALYNGVLAGFITLKLNPNNMSAEIPLNAISPRFSGRGIYQTLVEFTLDYLETRGYRSVDIWTHLSNFAVQRTWQKLGAKPKSSAHQFRRFFEEP